MQLLLSGNNLVKPDRMGMAVSLEARTPFLDYRMMEFAFTMPGHLKLRDGVTKYLFKKAATPLIGEDLAYRKKQMFTVPVGEWFRNELRDYCEHHVGAQSYFRRNGIFSEETDRLFRNHVQGSENNTRELRALIALDHWADRFAA
jgi:asparagine synthase (glutamine-hydrolysing)